MKTEETMPTAGTQKASLNIVKYVVIGVVVLAVLGYGVRYMMGVTAVGMMNADLKAHGVEVTGNPATGNATYNYKDEKGNKHSRELMTADEIRMTDACITIINNQPPLKFVPTPFYKSLRFRHLAKASPYVVKEKEIISPPRITFE